MQRRPQSRASQKARLATLGGAWALGLLGLFGCLQAQAPVASAAEKKKAHQDHALSNDKDEGHQDKQSKAPDSDSRGKQHKDKQAREKPKHADQGLQSVNLALKHGTEKLPKIKKGPSPSDRLDSDPKLVKDAQARLTESYRSKLEKLQERHLELNRRNKAIELATKELMSKMDDISALEDRLQRELGIGKARREYRGQRIKSLAALIMTMPPQSGARILANMSEQDAQEIVLGMAQKSERKAAKILAQMPPNKAAELSQRYLARRNHIKGSEGLFHNGAGDNAKKGNTP